MKISTLFLCLFLMQGLLAQNTGRISGSIQKNELPADAATVSLLRAKDSATVKLAVTNKDGRYLFEQIPNGNYILSATAVGYKKIYSSILTVSLQTQEVTVANMSLLPSVKELGDVTVTSKKPLVEQRIDRTIVNVEASITNIGTSALEVLEKSPGITVDRDGNVSLKGKQGVTIMVDGRPTQLSGADLTNLLRSMNSNQLDQIEIMTNPPAKYDAAGTSGVINIKTKKTITAGLNGSVNVSYSQGRYPKTSEGFNFNYRTSKINLFTNLSHNYQKRFQLLDLDRNILVGNDNSIDKIFNQSAYRVSAGNSYSAKAGLDFFANKNTTIGAVVNLNTRAMNSNNPNTTYISNASKELETITTALVSGQNEWNSISTNLNFRRTLNKKGAEITSDIDWIAHRSDNDQFMKNSYTDAMGTPINKADTLIGLLPQDINVYSARIDYSLPIKKDVRFEAGIKTSAVKTDNNARYDSIQYGVVIPDVQRSNHFIYEENINAAYMNLSSPLSKKITAQFGLRLENTNAKGRQKTTGQNFDRHYTQLFPTAYLQYKANENNNFGFNLGRRIRRPNYQSLNPFIRFIDRYTYAQGNPNLKPSISTNLEISHTWKNSITTTVGYLIVKDMAEEVIQQKGQEAYNMPSNVGTLKSATISINASNTITKWWTSNLNFNITSDKYVGMIDNAPISLSATNFFISGTQQFKLNKTLTAELNGNFRSGWLEGVLRTKPVGLIGAGLSQQIMKKKATIRLTARDIFYTQKMKGKSQYGNVDVTIRQRGDTQVVTLGFTYNFSKGKKIAPVKRTAGSSGEEQNRIGQ